MKVEQALRLVPALEALGPLRTLVLASSSPDERARWGSAASYSTVGKWEISPDLLRRRIPAMLDKVAAHLGALYRLYADALEHEAGGDQLGVATQLLAAARLEERVGRYAPALSWAEIALGVAEGLNTRRMEIEALEFVGRVAVAQGRYPVAGRAYQRALVLAEAEFDQAGSIDASEGQGLVALALGQLPGAAAWLGRAERLASGDEQAGRRARVQRALAEVARQQGDLAQAGEWLRRSHETFEALEDAVEMARTLDAEGRLHHALGRAPAALAAFRESLAWERRAGSEPRVECDIRLHLAEFYLSQQRIPEAEEEFRHAERLAVAHNLGRRLIQVYTHLGMVRGQQGKETGFVYFEQALMLCRLLEGGATLEAEVYHRYGCFKATLGRGDEARAWLERARELFAEAGGSGQVEQVDADLRRLSA